MNELTISLDTKSKIPLYEQIYRYIRRDIRDGRIGSGEKLPSTRALSKHLEISRSTVELAYEQLLSEGYLEAEPCRGYFVAEIEAYTSFGLRYGRQNKEAKIRRGNTDMISHRVVWI